MIFRSAFALAIVLSACTANTRPVPESAPPPIVREMRGLWVATVNNIDWPSTTTLDATQQRAELVDILDRAKAAGFNAIIFQVRPAGDAVYPSQLEPWAAMLSGKQGTDPGWDPLAFVVDESHKRGLELHAWINPFRAGNTKDSLSFAPTHYFATHRDLIRVYGSQLWFDPGEQAVQDHAMEVIRDIITRYDVDAIHADDYFYPYRENDRPGHEIDFPDSASYARSGTTLSQSDWRRDNINRFVQRLSDEAHRIKPTIQIGLSPFGIWRPGNPPSVMGLDAFESIYADSRKWFQSGWVDYFAPQLYWAIAAPQQSYPALLDWWISQNTMGRHLWPGLAAYRVTTGSATQFSPTEIADQIALTRQRPGATGEILFNTVATLKHAGSGPPVATSLATLYARPALTPQTPWLDSQVPTAPSVTVTGRTLRLAPAGAPPRWWSVRSRSAAGWRTDVLFGTARELELPERTDWAVVNAVSATGMTSADAEWRSGHGSR